MKKRNYYILYTSNNWEYIFDDYKFCLDKLGDGDLIFVATKKFQIYGTAIQKLTHSKINHVGALISRGTLKKYHLDISYDINKDWFVLEALIGGYQITPLSKYIKTMCNNENDLVVKRLSPSHFASRYECEKRKKVALDRRVEWANKVRPYDKKAIIGFTINASLKILFRNLGFKNNWLNSKDKVFCSEAECEAHYLKGDKVSIFIGKKDKKATCATITPGDECKSDKLFYITGKKDLK